MSWDLEDEKARTMERHVQISTKTEQCFFDVRLTKRMPVMDPHLLALARGETIPRMTTAPPPPVAADDPFGGLIPVDDDGHEISMLWLMSEPDPFSAK